MAILLHVDGSEEGREPKDGVRFTEEEIAELIPGSGKLTHRRIPGVPVFPSPPAWPHFTAMVYYRKDSTESVNQGVRKYLGGFDLIQGKVLLIAAVDAPPDAGE
jgi:hypothetical protein